MNKPTENNYPVRIELAPKLQPEAEKNRKYFAESMLTLNTIDYMYERDIMMWTLCHLTPAIRDMLN